MDTIEIKPLNPEIYHMGCFHCGCTENLNMVPHRRFDRPVGILFLCERHIELYLNKEMKFEIVKETT